VAAGAFEFREFAPCTFQSLRQQYGIDNESFRSSLAKPGAVSRIDEKHFISADKRFTLLAISQREAETLLRILPHYFQHVTRNRHTLLPRFYGLYKLRIPKGETLRIVVTATFADCDGPIDSRFELAPDSKESVFKGKLYVGEQQATAIRQQLSRDCKFLKKASISGHALLVAIQRGKRPAELRYPVDTRMLLRPTVPHPNGGKERGMVSVFEQENGGVRAYEPGNPERSGEIYFFRIDRMLQHAIDIKDGSDRALVQQAASRSQRYNNRFLEIVLNLLV
jgi:1-phosphatidylinositol-4-phosphate 5-kinase